MNIALALGDALASAFLRWVSNHQPPRQPLPLSITLLSEESGMLRCQLQLPPPGAPDVVLRELTQVINGIQTVLNVEQGYTFLAEDGAMVSLSLVDIDDAGNRSEPSPTLTFTATDTIAPPTPGELGVTVIGEE